MTPALPLLRRILTSSKKYIDDVEESIHFTMEKEDEKQPIPFFDVQVQREEWKKKSCATWNVKIATDVMWGRQATLEWSSITKYFVLGNHNSSLHATEETTESRGPVSKLLPASHWKQRLILESWHIEATDIWVNRTEPISSCYSNLERQRRSIHSHSWFFSSYCSTVIHPFLRILSY